MKNIIPKCSSTEICASDCHVWRPVDFKDFLIELDHIISACTGNDPCPLFRGHSDSKWMLDSTFARTCKSILFGIQVYEIPNEIKYSLEFNNYTQILHLLKYGVFCPATDEQKNVVNELLPHLKNKIIRPPGDLWTAEDEHDIDPWFELMKRIQQFSGEDHPHLKGSFFLDWTQSKDIALYFANYDNDRERTGDGAVYICDKVITGKILMHDKEGNAIKVSKILEIILEKINNGESMGKPLIFFPPKTIKCQRTNNQQAVYFAQMDLRCSLEEIWKLQEEDFNNELVYMKLILPDGTQKEHQDYLLRRGITKEFVYPKDKQG